MRILLLLGILLLYATVSFACHKDLGDPYIGHHKWSSSSGLLISTENSTAAISTSTWCNSYTSFLEHKYEAIAMEAANGEGPHINILAAFEGCPIEIHSEFSHTLKLNYRSIFDKPVTANSPQLRRQIGRMVSASDFLRNSCNMHEIEEV